MAFCNGLSHFLPVCSSNFSIQSAKHERSRVSFVSRATKNKWNIAEDVALTSDSSGFHPCQHLNEQSKCYLEKIQDVRNLLRLKAETDPTEILVFVDAIQRLGISSYFQEEIETILQQLYMATSNGLYGFNTLHDVSLLFRLLRQHGYYISSDVFNNFKGKDGRFRSKLSQDIRGLMELHEAAQMSFMGEHILDEAASFSSQLLQESLAGVGNNWSRVITNTLRHPYHKSIKRLTEKNFSQDFGGLKEYEATLRELVVMDLHNRQSVYQEELLQISKWWNELGLANSLKLVRNQPLKWYAWSMTILIDDISASFQRVELTKSIAFIYLIDDLFDLYGTVDELIIFTEAVTKWDYAAIDTLPDYMKMCYRSLLDTTHEIGQKIHRRHGFNPIDSLKTTWASLCNAFLAEAKWFDSGDLPRAEVYLENGKVSSGVHVVLVHLFYLLGLGGVDGNAICLKDASQLISSVATILRLWDDLGSAKDEHQDGEDGSYIECYRKDNPGVSDDQARDHAIDMIANEWKSLNRECFCLNHFPTSPLKRASLNFARLVDLMYSYDDNQQLPVLEEYVNFMLSKKTKS